MADGWSIVGQRQTKTYDGMTFQDVMEIRFKTAAGVGGTVDIPLASYGDVDYVRDIIQKRVDAINAVHTL